MASMPLVRRSTSGRGRVMAALAHGRLDIGRFELCLVIAHSGVAGSKVHGHALDAGHLADPLLDFIDAEYGQHVVDFNGASLHDGFLESGGQRAKRCE